MVVPSSTVKEDVLPTTFPMLALIEKETMDVPGIVA